MKLESSRIVELDGLRGIAIAAVILFHLVLFAPTASPVLNRILLFGWSGVDLFFVLSGFLIGGILIDHRDSLNYFTTFYARRFFRIVPIYFSIVGLYFLCYAVGGILRSELMKSVGPPMPLISYLSFTNNLWIAHSGSMTSFASPTWSLAIEEQFYLTLPLLVRLLKPKYLPAVIALLVAFVVAFRFTVSTFHLVSQTALYVLPFFRADALMIGVGCALAVRSRRLFQFLKSKPWLLYSLLLLFAVIILRSGGKLDQNVTAPINTYGFTFVALFYATLLLIAVVFPNHPIAAVLRSSRLRSLGRLAYCVYLLQESVLLAVFNQVRGAGLAVRGIEGWVVGLAAIAIVIAVANLSWKYFESRLIRVGHRFKYSQPLEKASETAVSLAS